MTIPAERTRAVLRTADFLSDLLDPEKTPRVPTAVREQARMLLRHYPSAFELSCVARAEAAQGTYLRLFDERTASGWAEEHTRRVLGPSLALHEQHDRP